MNWTSAKRRRMSWDEQRQVQLVKLAECEMLQAREIANALGPGFTRNAVIGRCHRTGVKLCGAVPHETNLEAMLRRSEKIRATTLYPCGHPRTEENSVRTTLHKNKCGTERLVCRTCKNRRARDRRARRKYGETMD